MGGGGAAPIGGRLEVEGMNRPNAASGLGGLPRARMADSEAEMDVRAGVDRSRHARTGVATGLFCAESKGSVGGEEAKGCTGNKSVCSRRRRFRGRGVVGSEGVRSRRDILLAIDGRKESILTNLSENLYTPLLLERGEGTTFSVYHQDEEGGDYLCYKRQSPSSDDTCILSAMDIDLLVD